MSWESAHHAPVLWRHPAQRARWELAAASLRGFRSTLDGLGFTEHQRDRWYITEVAA